MRVNDAMRWGAALAAICSVVVSLVAIGLSWSSSILPALVEERTATGLTAVLVATLIVGQIWVAVALLKGSRTASSLGRRSAVANATVALVLVGFFGTSRTVLDSYSWNIPFSAFASVWLGFYPATSFLLPIFLLIQWFCLAWTEEAIVPRRNCWRGAAIACILYSAVLGTWTFSPMIASWRFFDSPTDSFFNIGVLIHLFAILWLAMRWRGDWALAGLIGFGCLISGLILINQRFANDSYGPIDSSTPLREIGSTIKFGWHGLTNYLPPIAYVLTALSAVALFRSRNKARRDLTPGNVKSV